MTTNYSDYDLQLYGTQTGVVGPGAAIISSGGTVYVAVAGAAQKATLYNPDSSYASLANPMTPTRGKIRFATLSTVLTVDLYIQAPNGQFSVIKGVAPGGPIDLAVNGNGMTSTMVIPFAIGDTAAATETDTGFDMPTDSALLPSGVGVYVSALHASKTIDVGILSSESGGDADGFIKAASLTLTGFVPAVPVATAGTSETYFSSTTLGALLCDFLAGTDLDKDTGLANPKPYRSNGTAKSISYTLSSATTTAKGFIVLPIELVNVIAA